MELIKSQLRQAYKAWHDSKGTDVGTWLQLLHDDIVIGSLADGAAGMEFSAARRGIAQAESYLRDVTRDWEMLYFTPDEIISEGDRVVMRGRCGWRFKATNKCAESVTIQFWRFKDGKAIEMLEFYDTAKAFAATQPELSLA